MNFKKKFDYSDTNNFLPDNVTIGTAEYYKEKFHGKLPDYYYEMFEMHAKPQYDTIDIEEMNEMIKKYKRDIHEKVLKEFWERENEISDPYVIDVAEGTNKLSDNQFVTNLSQ